MNINHIQKLVNDKNALPGDDRIVDLKSKIGSDHMLYSIETSSGNKYECFIAIRLPDSVESSNDFLNWVRYGKGREELLGITPLSIH